MVTSGEDTSKKMEINPSHPAIKELFKRVTDNVELDDDTKELITLLYEAALINSGYEVVSPTSFTKRFFRLYNGALGLDKDAAVEDVEVDLDEESEEE